jgi:hypothetical protein
MSSEPTDDPKLGCGVAVAALMAVPFLAVLRGWVLSILWAWFMVPLGMRPIGIAHAIGVGILVSMFTMNAKMDENKPTTARVVKGLLFALIGPLILLTMAAIAHWFMPAIVLVERS